MTVVERIKDFLRGRRLSYLHTFAKDNQHAQVVLHDLAKFCRANSSAWNPDPRLHAVLEGRREVFLRITTHLRLTEDELWAIYGRKDLE